MKLTVGLLIASATLESVVAWGQQPLMQLAQGPNDVTFAQLEVGVDSPVKKSGVKVIRSEDEWEKFLAKMNETTAKRPKIDWTKFQVVVATLEGSTNSGITLHVNKLHNTKPGKTDIEIGLDQQIGNSRLIDTTNSNNYLGHTQYPYAIIQTPLMETKWNIKVADAQ